MRHKVRRDPRAKPLVGHERLSECIKGPHLEIDRARGKEVWTRTGHERRAVRNELGPTNGTKETYGVVLQTVTL